MRGSVLRSFRAWLTVMAALALTSVLPTALHAGDREPGSIGETPAPTPEKPVPPTSAGEKKDEKVARKDVKKPRPTSWSTRGAHGLDSGSFVLHAAAGVPFLELGATVGIARRLDIGVALQSVYTLVNAPELNVKLNLLAPPACTRAPGGSVHCAYTHALSLFARVGYMLGGSVKRTSEIPGEPPQHLLSGLPTFIDDTRHVRIVGGLGYSADLPGILAFLRLQTLIQVFTEDTDPTGAPRENASFLPELVFGFELPVARSVHFWLELGGGAYIDSNFVPEGAAPGETDTRVRPTGHAQAGLALHLF